MKRQLTEREQIFANHVSAKGLVPKITKISWNLVIKINNPILKWAKDQSRHFSKENIQMTNKHIKWCSTLSATREMQIKTTKRNHFTPTRMVKQNRWTMSICKQMDKEVVVRIDNGILLSYKKQFMNYWRNLTIQERMRWYIQRAEGEKRNITQL